MLLHKNNHIYIAFSIICDYINRRYSVCTFRNVLLRGQKTTKRQTLTAHQSKIHC